MKGLEVKLMKFRKWGKPKSIATENLGMITAASCQSRASCGQRTPSAELKASDDLSGQTRSGLTKVLKEPSEEFHFFLTVVSKEPKAVKWGMITSSQKWIQSGTLFWTELVAGRQRKTYSQKSFHRGKRGEIIKAQRIKALLKFCLNPSVAKATQHHFPQWRLNSKTPDCHPQLHGKVVTWTAANRAALRKFAFYGQGQTCRVHACPFLSSVNRTFPAGLIFWSPKKDKKNLLNPWRSLPSLRQCA